MGCVEPVMEASCSWEMRTGSATGLAPCLGIGQQVVHKRDQQFDEAAHDASRGEIAEPVAKIADPAAQHGDHTAGQHVVFREQPIEFHARHHVEFRGHQRLRVGPAGEGVQHFREAEQFSGAA